MQISRMPVLIAALALGIGACDSNSTGVAGESRVTVHLTDAPGDVLEAVVTIDEIYLQGGAGGRVTLSDTPFTVDLVQLNNIMVIVVDGVTVPAGQYNELRFVISGGYLVVEGSGGEELYASAPDYEGLPQDAEVTGTLQMPSFGQAGIKVNFDGMLDLTGSETDLLVDFDVSQSFGRLAGNSGMWVMHPVIKGAELVEAADVVVTLALGAGVTLPNIGGTQVTLADFKASLDGEELPFAQVNGVWQAVFQHVLPDTYTLTVVGPAGVTFAVSPAVPMDVVVGVGADVTVPLTLTSASGP